MVKMPKNVVDLLNDPKASKVIATVGNDGNPHAIMVGSINAPAEDKIAVGVILMEHTNRNIEEMKSRGQKVAVLVGKEMESYQIKANITDYQTSGPIFEAMKTHIEKLGLKLKGVWLLEPVEVWNQSANYEAGKRIV